MTQNIKTFGDATLKFRNFSQTPTKIMGEKSKLKQKMKLNGLKNESQYVMFQKPELSTNLESPTLSRKGNTSVRSSMTTKSGIASLMKKETQFDSRLLDKTSF